MKTTTLLLSAILLAFTACSQNDSNSASNVANEEVRQEQEVEQTVKRVKKAEFKTFMADHSDYVLIDIRTPEEYSKGTIDGAVNINFYNDDFQAELNKLDKTKPVLMFCQSGGRSGRALPVFKSLGFEQVLELEGGYSRY